MFQLLGSISSFIYPDVQLVLEEEKAESLNKLFGADLQSCVRARQPDFVYRRMGLSVNFVVNFCYSMVQIAAVWCLLLAIYRKKSLAVANKARLLQDGVKIQRDSSTGLYDATSTYLGAAHDNIYFMFLLSLFLALKYFGARSALDAAGVVAALLLLIYYVLYFALVGVKINEPRCAVSVLRLYARLKLHHLVQVDYFLADLRKMQDSGPREAGLLKRTLVRNYHLVTLTKKFLVILIVAVPDTRATAALALVFTTNLLYLVLALCTSPYEGRWLQ